MSFTDDDLKRLKEDFESYCDGDPRILTGSDWLGLIDHLKAAEKVCEFVEWYWPKGEANLEATIVSWRKAAGRA